jgi:DNA-binding LacI/PurR family transcriptional regulator
LGPTIYDIARLAKVSKSTVSRVLNNQPNISEQARQRVLKAIEELNYQPSKLARGLSTGFDAILVLTRSSKTTADNPFFSEVLQLISSRAEEENYDVIIQTSKNSKDELEKCISKIKEKMIKGIIMLSSPADESLFKELDVFNIPICVIGKIDGNYQNVFSLDTNNYQDSYNLCQYLIEQGHRDIACLHSPLDYHVSIDRLEGYKDCLLHNGLHLRKEWVIDCGYTFETAFKAIHSLLKSKQLPTAIFATDDLKVMSVYKYALENGISIPQDLSVLGYCNSNFTPFLSPSLTRIEIPIKTLGGLASKLLFSKIKENKDAPLRTIIPTEIIIEKSVKKLN